MVSARLVDCPDEPEEAEMQPNPDMMFAFGEEPVGVRILTYQSSTALERIIKALDEEEVAIIKQSSFGKLLEIAEKPAFSGRFARYMLSRQMKTTKKHEAWFRFAGKPVKFSLREFAIVTGLPCGKYTKKSKMKLKETISEQPYWPSLFGKVDSVSVSAVIKMLYRKTVKDRDIRIKYACLALLESVLLPTSLNMKISRDHAEAIKDLDAFFSYPWGRVAFDMLMDSIKERDELALSRDTIAVKGFVLALQLVMIEAVPALTEAGQDSCSSSESDSDDIDLTAEDIFTKKPRLNPSHARKLDTKTDVRVSIVLDEDPSRPLDNADLEYSDEEHDSRVASMVARSRFDYQFNNSSFGGGLTMNDLDHLRNCEGSSRKAKKGKKVATKQKDVQIPNITNFVIEKLKPQLEQLEKNMHVTSSTVASVEGNVRKQVEGLLGKFREEMVTTVKELVSAQCREHMRVPNVASKTQASTARASQKQDDADANAMYLKDALDNISSYSTPPPATQMNENVNPTPITKHRADSGYISATPVSHGPAQSANSEYRVRQNSFMQSLEVHKRDAHNLEDEPSFSLGLTQEEHVEVAASIAGAVVGDGAPSRQTNVADNIQCGLIQRKSKRQRMVPTGLVEDYQCGVQLMSRRKESQRSIFVLKDMGELSRKYAKLVTKLKENVVCNVSGLAVYGREIRVIVERPRIYAPKVVDILIRVLRSTISHQMPQEGPHSAVFLDSKFVLAINRNYPKFRKSANKTAYVFPKLLTDIFPTKEAPMPNPTRYYFPCIVGNKHWVGICFDSARGIITVLDCILSANKDSAVEASMHAVVQMLPYLARYVGQPLGVDPVLECYDFARPKSVAQISNPADSGLMALLLMGNHALFGVEACKTITQDMLEEEGKRAGILAYEFNEEL